MQISRHWRLNSQRYRLQGVRYENGEVSLQARPLPTPAPQPREPREIRVEAKAAVNAH
jgi:hypothetical protein